MKEKFIKKACKKHGITDFILENRGYYRCKKCRSLNVSKQRKKNKLWLINKYGGKCVICGYNKYAGALQFHHLKKEEKKFGISENGLCRRKEELLNESKKCILVCANCHSEIENDLNSQVDQW